MGEIDLSTIQFTDELSYLQFGLFAVFTWRHSYCFLEKTVKIPFRNKADRLGNLLNTQVTLLQQQLRFIQPQLCYVIQQTSLCGLLVQSGEIIGMMVEDHAQPGHG